MRKGRVLAAAAVFCLATGCRRIPESATASGSASAKAGSVIVYCSTDREFAEPVFRAFEQKTGTKVLPVYDTEETKTAGLTARLVAEAAHPKADVFWSSDTSRAVALVERGLAAPYASPSAAAIPPAYRDPQSRWTGFAARIRVILYNTERVKPEEAPKSILDFTRPAWRGRFAIPNPHFGTMSFQAAALFVKWGEGRATEFFRALKENGAVIAAGNSDVKDRVSDGRVAAGIVDEDDAVVALREKKPVAIVIPDQQGADALGTPVMPNTAMEVRGAPHPEEARRFLDFLLSAEAESILARSDAAQFPLHPGVPGPPALPPLEKIRPMEVDYGAVARQLQPMDANLKTALGI
jgi:iron(III) transport system substrate-binding protein